MLFKMVFVVLFFVVVVFSPKVVVSWRLEVCTNFLKNY